MTDFEFDFSDVPRLPEGYRYRLVHYSYVEYEYLVATGWVRKVVVEKKVTTTHKPWFRQPYQTYHWEEIGSASLPRDFTLDNIAKSARYAYLKAIGFNGKGKA